MIDYPLLLDIARTLTSQQWTFAKTMPNNPHYYTLKKKWQNPAEFERIVRLIRQYGYQEYFWRKPYTMLDINDKKYWTMGAPVPETTLINRKFLSVDSLSPYDAIASQYDEYFSDPASLAEDEALLALLPEMNGAVLDVGCGTGFLLDHVSVKDYTGIDPATLMLARLKAKHPACEDRVMASPFESFVGLTHVGQQFDLIVALYGTASYIAPDAWQRLSYLLKPDGRYFLMFYQPEYPPKTHTLARQPLGSLAPIPDWGDAYQPFGEYMIVTGEVAHAG